MIVSATLVSVPMVRAGTSPVSHRFRVVYVMGVESFALRLYLGGIRLVGFDRSNERIEY